MTSKPSPLNLRDAIRIALIFAILAYAQLLSPLPLWAVVVRLYVVGTTCVSIAHFSRGRTGTAMAWDVVYGLLVCLCPFWGRSLLRMTWLGCNIDGWRFQLVYYTFVARKLIYLLPANYGSDVETLLPEYEYAYIYFRSYVGTFTLFIVYLAFWRKGYSWMDVVVAHSIMTSFVEYLYLAHANYVHLQKTGRTIRQDIWPYKDMFTKKWATNDRGQRLYRINHTLLEHLEWLQTGRVKDRD